MNSVVNRYPSSSSRGVIVLHHNSRIRDQPTREADGHPNVKMAVQLCQSTRSGPLGPNRASLLMNPMYSIARTRQCPRKSCSPQRSSSYSAHPSGWYSYSSNSKDAGFIDAPMPISPHCIAAAHVQAPPSAGVGSRNGSCVGSVESNIKINLTAKHPHYKTN